MTVSLNVYRSGNGIQLSIDDEDFGYRLEGPKFMGNSQCILSRTLTESDAFEIRRYLDRAFPQENCSSDVSPDDTDEVQEILMHQLVEVTGTVAEYMDMPCESLRLRMQQAALRAEARMLQVKNGDLP